METVADHIVALALGGGAGAIAPLVLVAVLSSVVHVGDATLDVVLYPVHRVAAELQPRDRAAVAPPEVMRLDPVADAEPLADRAHDHIEVVDRPVTSTTEHVAPDGSDVI